MAFNATVRDVIAGLYAMMCYGLRWYYNQQSSDLQQFQFFKLTGWSTLIHFCLCYLTVGQPTLNQDGKLNATVPTTQTYVVFEGEQ